MKNGFSMSEHGWKFFADFLFIEGSGRFSKISRRVGNGFLRAIKKDLEIPLNP